MHHAMRLALRRFARRPAAAAGLVCTLAMGIGATVAVLTVIDRAVVNRPAWSGADTLVSVYDADARDRAARPSSWDRESLSLRVWTQLRASAAFEQIEVWNRVPAPILQIDGRPVGQCNAVSTSSGLLALARTSVQVGRPFGAEDDLGPSDAVLISSRVWHRWFGGREDVVGRAVTLAIPGVGQPWTKRIVGVLSGTFRIAGIEPDLVLTLHPNPSFATQHALAIARLRPGTTRVGAEGASTAVLRSEEGRDHAARLVSVVDDEVNGRDRPLWMLLAGAVLLWLIACSNVSSLLLSAVVGRAHDVAIHAALGAARAAIVWPFVCEYAVLALAGSIAGFGVAVGLTRVLSVLAPDGILGVTVVSPDARLAAAAVAIGLMTTIAAGSLPLLRVASVAPGTILGTARASTSRRRQVFQRGVVAFQVALTIALLVGGDLFAETALRLRAIPIPFNADDLYVVEAQYLGAIMGRDETLPTRPVVAALAALPGVEHVATVSTAPFFGEGIRVSMTTDRGLGYLAEQRVVSEDYFSTMEMPLLQGSGLIARAAGGTAPAVVSESFVSAYLGQPALGRRFNRGDTVTYEVVGVVPDVKKHAQVDQPAGTFYVLSGATYGHLAFVIRTSPHAALTADEIRAAFASAGRLFEPITIRGAWDQIAATMANETFRAVLSTAFAAAAFSLATVGLYALALQDSLRRRRDFAIKLALGAPHRRLLLQFLRQSASPVLIGLCCGAPIAFLESKAVQALLYGVAPTSVHVYAGAALALLATTVVSTLVPAIKALAIDLRATLAEE